MSATTKLVRLRTAPMPDPGEWCNVCALLCDAPMIPPDYVCCSHQHVLPARERRTHKIRRPQSCIDAAEVET